jgi:inosine-uridine nucleoside N-ribohydrolase
MTAPQSRLRLWIDTDVGGDPDDAVALALAALDSGVELIGVSTVLGDVAARAAVAREVLSAFGGEAPVYAGPPPLDALDHVDALLAIGPLTNVAYLVERGAAIPARVAVMGGALAPTFHRGERHEVEFNFSCDPHAAATVVERVPHAVLVPLDVTARLVLDDRSTHALCTAAPSLRASVARWNRDGSPLCLHDPLALLALLGAAPVETRHIALVVDADGRVRETSDGTAHETVVDVDARVAIDRVLQRLGALPEGD